MKVFEFSVRAILGSFEGPPFGRPSLNFGTFAKYTYFQHKAAILPSEASQKSTRKSRINNTTQVLEGFLAKKLGPLASPLTCITSRALDGSKKYGSTSRESPEAPREPPEATREPQEAPRAPRNSQRAPRSSQRAPRSSQRAPRSSQRAPRSSQKLPEAARELPEAPREPP